MVSCATSSSRKLSWNSVLYLMWSVYGETLVSLRQRDSFCLYLSVCMSVSLCVCGLYVCMYVCMYVCHFAVYLSALSFCPSVRLFYLTVSVSIGDILFSLTAWLVHVHGWPLRLALSSPHLSVFPVRHFSHCVLCRIGKSRITVAGMICGVAVDVLLNNLPISATSCSTFVTMSVRSSISGAVHRREDREDGEWAE